MIEARFCEIETPLPAPRGGWRPSRFRASYRDTLGQLEYELGRLDARDIVIHADIPRGEIRLDGWPRANACFRSPGLTITFESRHGPLRYDCATYSRMEDNLRAFAMTLRALREVDRHGASRGEQYRGWAKLPAGGDRETHARRLAEIAGCEDVPGIVRAILVDPDERKRVYRIAAKRAHPDTGGNAGSWSVLETAMRGLGGAA